MDSWLDSSNALSGLIGLLAFCILLFSIRKLTLRRTPPGPWGYPVLGCLPHIFFAGNSVRTLFHNWYRKYGPIYNLKIGSANVVILSDYKYIREALVRPEFQDRAQFDFHLDRPGTGVVLSSGRVWQDQRKFVYQHFRDFGVGKSSFEEVVAAEAKCLTEALLKLDGQFTSIEHFISNAVSNVICSVSFGRRFDYDDQRFHALLDKLSENMEASMVWFCLSIYLPFTKFIPIGGSKAIRKNLETYFKFHDDILAEHKSKFDEGNIKDLMDGYLAEINKKEVNELDRDESFNDNNMLWTIAELFTAGTETTTTTLMWTFLFLLKHPKVEARIRSELDRVVGRNRYPSYSDRQQMPYVEAVLSESLRLGTASYLSLPHVASRDSTIFGYDIPKGTLIIPNFHALFTDEDKWDKPEEFRPERFLDKDGKLIKREDFIPFSAGRRLCSGEQLARMELFIFLTHILQNMRFSVPDGISLPSDRGIDGFTHKPHPYKVLLTKCPM